METGIDKKQIEAIKRFVSRVGGDPGRLKTAICVIVAGLGLFAVERPLGLRLDAARRANAKAKAASQMGEEAVLFTRQRALYEPRVACDAEITDWQNYVLDMLRSTGAMLISLEPRKATPKGPFQVVEMELVAKGSSYNEFADFVERLERGPRLVRLEKLRMERQQGTIYLTMIVKGLVKPSAKKPAPKAGAGGANAQADDAAAADADDARPDVEGLTPDDGAGDVELAAGDGPTDGEPDEPAPEDDDA